jgi:hypothetical protein
MVATHPSRLRAKQLLIIGVVGILSFAFGGNQAWATCGDYLAHPGSHWPHVGEMQSGSLGTADRSHSLPGERPCRGPNCGQQPVKPMPAPQQRVVVSPERELANLVVARQVFESQQSWFVADEEEVTPLTFCLRVFRPPRGISSL